MNNWIKYLRTAVVTFSLAGSPVGIAYSYHKAQDQLERVKSVFARDDRLEEEILGDEVLGVET